MLDKVLEGGGEPAVSGRRPRPELRRAARVPPPRSPSTSTAPSASRCGRRSTLETCVAAVAALATGTPLVPVNPKLGRSELEHVLDRLETRRDLRRPRRHRRRPRRPRGELPDEHRDRRGPGADHLHVGHHRAGPRARCSRAARSPPTSTGSPTPGSGPARTSSPTACRSSTSTGSCSACSARCAAAASCATSAASTPQAAAQRSSDGATMLFGVPTMYHRLAARRSATPPSPTACKQARLLVSGSAPLPAPEFTRIEQLTGQQIVERYGLTETLMNTAVRADGERKPGYVGVPVPGRRGPPRRRRRQRARRHRRRDDRRGRPSAAPTSSPATSTAPTRPPRRCATAGSSPATSRPSRDGRLLAHRRPPLDRPDQDRRLQGRRRRDRGRAARPPRRQGGRRHRRARRRPRREDRRLGRAPRTTQPDAKALIDHVAGELAPHKRPREVRFLDELPRNAMGKVVEEEARGLIPEHRGSNPRCACSPLAVLVAAVLLLFLPASSTAAATTRASPGSHPRASGSSSPKRASRSPPPPTTGRSRRGISPPARAAGARPASACRTSTRTCSSAGSATPCSWSIARGCCAGSTSRPAGSAGPRRPRATP